MALLFLFLLIATVVAARRDREPRQLAEHATSSAWCATTIQDQINGIRDLIDQSSTTARNLIEAATTVRRAAGGDAASRADAVPPDQRWPVMAGVCAMPSSSSAVGNDVGQDPALAQLHGPAP